MRAITMTMLVGGFLMACGGDTENTETTTNTATDPSNTTGTTTGTTGTGTTTGTTGTNTTGTNTGTGTTTGCTATLVDLDPDDGGTAGTVMEVYATFSEAVADDEWSLAIDGVAGSSMLADDGMSATFSPDDELASLTDYTIEGSVCGAAFTATFTTAESVSSSVIEGVTYGLEYADLVYTEPATLTSTLEALDLSVDISHIVVQVLEVAEATETIRVAAGTAFNIEGTDTIDCEGVFVLDGVDYSANPTFVLGPQAIDLPLSKETVLTLEDFRLEGTFSESGDRITDVEVTGAIDVRPAGVPCSLMAFLASGTCVACADGEAECLVASAYASEALASTTMDIGTDCAVED